MRLEELGLIGNCQIAAHVRSDGAIVWSCMPRFDAEPVFGALLDEADGGHFTIGPAAGGPGTQRYLPNTNVLETVFETEEGSFRVVDFAPRFHQHGRSFRPTKLIRIVEPISGTPRVRVRCEPILGWSKERPRREEGSHHVSFLGYSSELRLTTDAPLSFLGGAPFALLQPLHFVLSFGAPVEEALPPLCRRFLDETVRYWQTWVKRCQIPARWQAEVIRSALTLKLHCFEDTGAIVAALTTSLPEAPRSGRTWDYRYCWLRDAAYTLGAFRLLGHFEEREQFLSFLLNVASASPGLELAPLYRIDGGTDLEERILGTWAGYEADGPVRVGNAAAAHLQHDVYGEMVLALTPLLLDLRFGDQVTPRVLQLVRRLADRAIALAGSPDAGIWEFRGGWRPQSFSTLMCWAGADRAASVARLQGDPDAARLATAAAAIRERLLAEAVDPARGALVADHGGTSLDASMLQAATLRLLPPDDPRLVATIEAIRRELDLHGWLLRYGTDDGFGVPTVAFTLCTFWLVEALVVIGRRGEAEETLARALGALSPLGLLAEDFDPVARRQHGNFPQAYAHVGLIHAAFAAAPPWSEVL